MSKTSSTVAFTESKTRADEMRETTDEWLDDLASLVDEAKATEAFRDWLDVQSRFHEYSYRNALLIKQQCPEATTVAGYRTWQTEFDRHVREGESAIWIWAPIIAPKCPGCENGQRYHERAECEEATPVDEWSKGLVGFKPAPVFDVSQTDGESLPELETSVTGDAGPLVSRLVDAADVLDVGVEVVPASEWTHGDASGVCVHQASDDRARIEVLDRSNRADLAATLVHEYAHALLHVDDEDERAKREVEAEAVAYVVSRSCGLDASGAAFYLAAWAPDGTDVLSERLSRISRTAAAIIEAIEG